MMAEMKRKSEPKSESTAKDSHKQTFRFGDEFSTVQNFHVSIRSAIRIRFLVLHGLNNLLARNHMTKNHMDTERIQTHGVDENLRDILHYAINQNELINTYPSRCGEGFVVLKSHSKQFKRKDTIISTAGELVNTAKLEYIGINTALT